MSSTPNPHRSRTSTPTPLSSSHPPSASSSARRPGAITSHSRSKSHMPPPRVLPFPDLPVRPLSRDTSPTMSAAASPTPTRRSSSQDVNAEGSGEAGPSRLRAQTGPSAIASSRPAGSSSSATLRSPTPTLHHTMRTTGFQPTPLSSPNALRPTTLPQTTPLPPSPLPPALPTLAPATPKPLPPPPIKKLSLPTAPTNPSSTVQIMPNPLMLPMQEHMRDSYVKGTCADVLLWVGKWGVAWRCHKVVLVQASFFHSLFLSGFSETAPPASSSSNDKARASLIGAEDEWMGEEVELRFDDPNITRAAFEICLSRLYSAYPRLDFPESLLPTPGNPLPLPISSASLRSLYSTCPTTPASPTLLATPHLLLSLLATTTYLGQQPLMREVLAMILRTVSPATVCRYLDFAVGHGVGEEEWEGQATEPAKGMDEIAVRIRIDHPYSPPESEHRGSVESVRSGDEEETKTSHSPQFPSTTTVASLHTHRSSTQSIDPAQLPHFYGFASNKLGETCVCFLARWGSDILELETSQAGIAAGLKVWSKGGLAGRWVRAVLGSDMFWAEGGEMGRYRIARRILDLRRKGWEQEGEMATGGDVGMADGIADEGDMGEEEDGWEEDEEELAKVFSEGIYYTHMTFKDLSTIAADIDPLTSLPFVPLFVLQAAHWSAADLRQRVLHGEEPELGMAFAPREYSTATVARRRGPRSRVTTPDSSFAGGNSSYRSSEPFHASTIFPVPSDDTIRLGASGLPLVCPPADSMPSSAQANQQVGIQGLPDFSTAVDADMPSSSTAKKPPPQSESTFFGIAPALPTMPPLLHHQMSPSSSSFFSPPTYPTSTYTRIQPLRFSVAFHALHRLPPSERAYSQTIWYAGSWWNVYVQTVRRREKEKGLQLGVYLHRQSAEAGERFPEKSQPGDYRRGGGGAAAGSSSDVLTGVGEAGVGGAGAGGRGTLPAGRPLGRATSASAVPSVGSPPATRTAFAAAGPTSPTSPDEDTTVEEGRTGEAYRDQRRVTKAYFSIACHSSLGTALIRFSSAPDSFTTSQSWGWKSSALRGEEYLGWSKGEMGLDGGGGGKGQEESVLGWEGEVAWEMEGCLRASVVVGVV